MIRIPIVGPRTTFDPFGAPIRRINSDMKVNSGALGMEITFRNVTGTFIGLAITRDVRDRILEVTLVAAPRKGGIIP